MRLVLVHLDLWTFNLLIYQSVYSSMTKYQLRITYRTLKLNLIPSTGIEFVHLSTPVTLTLTSQIKIRNSQSDLSCQHSYTYWSHHLNYQSGNTYCHVPELGRNCSHWGHELMPSRHRGPYTSAEHRSSSVSIECTCSNNYSHILTSPLGIGNQGRGSWPLDPSRPSLGILVGRGRVIKHS